ncbi:hypothetical protein E1956_03345 [Paraburkholderia pallida]|uniref:Transcriptional coactivator p15 (PC4) C-terminal domain-containing protein n=2 Tax=Paraburkholderia pallida TaxID=2547399 RepID=A0A4P7CWX6_9BURK|nr:hypothetical protein E1956_03345 [Paraburkholderia pallida]
MKKGRDSGKSATPTTRLDDTAAAPIEFLDIRRSDSERLRVTVSEYRGRVLIDLRVWYSTESGEFKPSRAGVSLRPEQIGEVVQALMLAARAVDPKGAI